MVKYKYRLVAQGLNPDGVHCTIKDYYYFLARHMHQGEIDTFVNYVCNVSDDKLIKDSLIIALERIIDPDNK